MLHHRTYYKYLNRIANGDKVPRKIKKEILGLKISKGKLKQRIKKLELSYYEPYKNGYIVPIVNDEFCPNCGCTETYSSGEMAEYPETWVRLYCLRCNTMVAEADNSWMIHRLVEIVTDETT